MATKQKNSLITDLTQHSKGMLAFSIGCGILSGLCSMGLISLVNTTLHESSSLPLWKDLYTYIFLLGAAVISGIISQVSLVGLGQKTLLSVRNRIVHRILSTPFQKLEEIGPSRLYAILTDDVQSLVDATQALPHLAVNGGILLGAIVYLLWLSPWVVVACAGVTFFGIYTYKALAKYAHRHLEASRNLNDTLFQHFHALVHGTKELKMNRLRQTIFLEEDLIPTAKNYQDQNVRGLNIFAYANQWGESLFFLLIGGFIFSRLYFESIDNEVILGATVTCLYILGPLSAVLNIAPALSRAKIAARKIESLALNEALLPEEHSSPSKLTSIELVQASYLYPNHIEPSFSLGPIELTIKPGELIFLVGQNGSGKSTLLKLITGLYTPSHGEIRLNGKKIATDSDLMVYRQNFSTVYSDFYLFNRLPIVNNQQNNQAAQLYLKQLHLDHKVRVQEGRLSTTALSQGQKKRLALLTAYLEDRPIYIFDEWAADQDPYFREIFYTEILPELKRKNKAILVASHDDRYFHLADRIIKMERGKIESYSSPQHTELELPKCE